MSTISAQHVGNIEWCRLLRFCVSVGPTFQNANMSETCWEKTTRQSTSMPAIDKARSSDRVSGCGEITAINKKSSSEGNGSKSVTGNAAAARMTVRAARARATWQQWQQRQQGQGQQQGQRGNDNGLLQLRQQRR